MFLGESETFLGGIHNHRDRSPKEADHISRLANPQNDTFLCYVTKPTSGCRHSDSCWLEAKEEFR